MQNKPEKQFINYIKKIMKNDWILTQIESRWVGTSGTMVDALYSCSGRHGIIEFKYQAEWPKRASTIVRLTHFTRGQKQCIYRHGKHGHGGAFLFLHIENQILIFGWQNIHDVGKLNRKDLETAAIWKAEYGRLTKFELCMILLRM